MGMNDELRGRILVGQKGLYTVETEDGSVMCKAGSKLRKDGIKLLCGDNVFYRLNDDKTGFIVGIDERKNDFIRPPVANMDLIVIVAAVKSPDPDIKSINMLTAIAHSKGTEVLIVLNKTDLDDPTELKALFEKCGYTVICTNAVSGEGVKELHNKIKGKTCFFAGVSGVGKSSLLHSLFPEISTEIGDISKKILRGKNTTRHTQLYEVGDGTYLADSPGFGMLDFLNFDLMDPDSLNDSFPEMVEYMTLCKYKKCSHTKEEGCAVIKAVEDGVIPKERHEAFCELHRLMALKKERRYS